MFKRSVIVFTSLFLISSAVCFANEAASEKKEEAASASHSASVSALSADEALTKLLNGNKRYVDGQFFHPHQMAKDRENVAKSQAPFAIIVSCSDSRVPPEVIFDQGIGDIFIIRDAGNIVGNLELGSIEYAAEHLKSSLVMVLGHERCGAVTATVKGGEVPGHIKNVVDAIVPAIARAKKEGDAVDNTIRANVELVVEQIKTSEPILAEMVKEGKIKVVGAYYDLDSGVIEVIQK